MKILLVNDYGTSGAGAERLIADLRDAMRARGHVVRVFSSRAELAPGVSMADATCFGTTSRLQTLTSAYNPSAARALAHEVRTFAPDVVHMHMFLWQLSPSILPVLAHVPTVYYMMTYKAVCPTGSKWLPSGEQCIERAGRVCLSHSCITPLGFVPLMAQRALFRRRRDHIDAIVPCSHAVRAECDADGLHTHNVIWPGSNLQPARPPLGDLPTVTFSGRMVAEKGVDVLLQAFHIVRQQLPTAQLRLAGHAPNVATPRDHESGVEWLGLLDEAALGAVLKQSWVHAVPSRWAEPFGLSATEAMMRGTAVVASRRGGLAESVEDDVSGFLVPAGDAPALAAALLRVLSDRARAEAMGAAARARAIAHFGIERCAERFESLYHQLQAVRRMQVPA